MSDSVMGLSEKAFIAQHWLFWSSAHESNRRAAFVAVIANDWQKAERRLTATPTTPSKRAQELARVLKNSLL
jgi:hypothetical protein